MRVFSTFEDRPSVLESKARNKHRNKNRKLKNAQNHKVKSERKSLSAAEIRDKISASKTAKLVTPKSKDIGKQVSEYMKPGVVKKISKSAIAEQVAKNLVANDGPKSDINKNDPNDPLVRSKLKDVLSMGNFSWSEKERAVLGKILAND